jgi:hypothetical protein
MDPESLENRNPPTGEGEQTTFLAASPIKLPLNLTEWVKPELLADWVRQAVKELDLVRPKVQDPAPAQQEERLRTNLAVLVYAYATQTYLNDEIIRACHSEPVFQGLCGHQPPFPEELKHFRRKFRAMLENTLTRILVRAVQEKYVEVGELPPGLRYSLSGLAADYLDTARHIDTWSE